jgi:arylsulfatase A-like enzyme
MFSRSALPALFCAFLAGACAAASAVSETDAPGQAAARPNVIVIMADDLGYSDVSAYGVRRVPTPNIDRIGTDGVIFTDGYVTAPVCGPSRAGLMTGRYQTRFGFEFNNGPARRDVEANLGLPPGEITLASALKPLGYATGLVGKWHLGANTDYYPTNRGFDEFVGLLSGATSYISPDTPGVRVVTQANNGEGAALRRNAFTQIVEGPDRRVVDNQSEYLTDYFARRAVDFISRRAPQEEPYFLYLTPTAPHDPLMTTQEYYDRFPEIGNEQNRVYAAMVSALDDLVGDVLTAVEASGEADNTIIVFLSDNGCAAYYPGMCACEPLRGGKLTQYEGGVRVPFMMRWPARLEGGQIYREMISSLDLFPTVVAAAGGTLARDRIYDGVDLAPFLTGEVRGAPHEMLAWRRSPLASIRIGDWKMWKDLEGEYTLLFNLREDANETTNLAQSRPDKLRELDEAWKQWARDLQDPSWPSRPHTTYNVCGTPFEVPI